MVIAMSKSEQLQPSPPVTTPAPPEGVEIIEGTTESPKSVAEAAKEGRVAIRPKEVGIRLSQKLAEKFSPDQITNTLASCMQATKTMVVGGKPFEVDDHKLRLDAVKLLMQYQIGMPVARSESVVHNVDTMQTLQDKLKKSPALRRAVGRMIDDESDGSPASGPVVDVSESEMQEAEQELQSMPEQDETPVQAEVRKRSMTDALRAKGGRDFEDKFG